MKVYHGSTQAVEYPLVGVGRENLDFGKGFYVTDIYAQAERWGAVMALRQFLVISRVKTDCGCPL